MPLLNASISEEQNFCEEDNEQRATKNWNYLSELEPASRLELRKPHPVSLDEEDGGDTSGIGTVMKKAGLTKGGFYRHFRSKDDLFVKAVARVFDEMGRGMLKVANAAPEGQALRAIIEPYLSTRHANPPGMGCVLAALGPELARKPLSVRKRIEAVRVSRL